MKGVLLILVLLAGVLLYIIEKRRSAYEEYLKRKKLCGYKTDDDEHYVSDCGINLKSIVSPTEGFSCPNCKKAIKIEREGE